MKKTLIAGAVSMAVANVAMAEKATFGGDTDLYNVQNRCIIQFQDGVDANDVKGLANALAKRGGASVNNVYKHAIKGFTANMPCHAAQKAFGQDASIKKMSPDGIVTATYKGKPGGGGSGGQQVSYGTGRVNGPVDGTGKTAWVVDSGIDLDHPDLNVDASQGFVANGINGGMEDQNGHGTHVAGTIAALNNNTGSLGVAPGATVVPIRVLNRRGSGSYSGIIAGLDHVASRASNGDCVNMSLGGPADGAVDDAVRGAAQQSGAYFVIAAGNDSRDADGFSPARVNGNNIYTIAAMSNGDNWASYSNYGNDVDYISPGSSIFSLWKNGGTNTISGTSMASPHACAVLMMGGRGTDGSVSDGRGGSYPILVL